MKASVPTAQTLSINYCHSSGPRRLALAPTVAYLETGDTITVDTLETSQVRFAMDGHAVELRQESERPFEGRSTLTVRTAGTAHFALKIRVPSWAAPVHAGAVEALGPEYHHYRGMRRAAGPRGGPSGWGFVLHEIGFVVDGPHR